MQGFCDIPFQFPPAIGQRVLFRIKDKTLSLMILHNSSAGSIKFSSLCQLLHQHYQMSARTLVSPVSDSQCLPTPMLLLYSSRRPARGQCPQCLMSVEMVVRRRRRRDTGIRYLLLPSLLTPGLSQGTTKDSPVPRPPLLVSHHSGSTQWFLARPRSGSQHSVRASLRLICPVCPPSLS